MDLQWYTDLKADFTYDWQLTASLHMRTTLDPHGRTIWKTLVLRSYLATLGYLPESSGTVAWLKRNFLKTLSYLAFL
jgi:hypothetical protein